SIALDPPLIREYQVFFNGTCEKCGPNGVRRWPDVSWIREDRVAALPKEQQEGFYHLCPDFVIELRSTIGRINRRKAQMEEYVANGAELGWLIDPKERTVGATARPRRGVHREPGA